MGFQIEQIENGFIASETSINCNLLRPRMSAFATFEELADFLKR